MLFDNVDTAKMHGLDTSNVSSRVVSSQVEFGLKSTFLWSAVMVHLHLFHVYTHSNVSRMNKILKKGHTPKDTNTERDMFLHTCIKTHKLANSNSVSRGQVLAHLSTVIK